ncbi:MAG: hypothetical protein IJ648_03840, partial [Lachnospiraceae bacterium]|nr:hypothetical protein [Lachnospiraceae bacterium]
MTTDEEWIMTALHTNWDEKHYKLIWTTGELNGMYMDFTYQEVGFSDCTAQRIEYKKLLVMKYLLEHSDDYVTGTQLNLVEEMNSIDLSKSISSIKMGIMKVLTQVYDRDKSEELWNQIIDRKKINGRMGYMLVTDGTELVAEDLPIEAEAEDHEVISDAPIDTGNLEEQSEMGASEELLQEGITEERSKKTLADDIPAGEAVPLKKGQEEAVAYLPANWLMLFAIFYAGIMLLFIMNARDLTYGMLLTRLIELPIRENLLIFI